MYLYFQIAKTKVRSFCTRAGRQNNTGYIKGNTWFKAPYEESKIGNAF